MAKAVLTNADRAKALEQKFKQLNIGSSQFKSGGSYDPINFLSTGQVEIDSILGVGGGIPYGTVVEFCGESQSGKSYLGYKIMSEGQKTGKWVCYVNAENAFYPPRAKELGVDVDNADTFKLLENIETAEEYGEAVYAMVESELFSVIVVDSISAMVPDAEFSKDLFDPQTVGHHARFVKRFVKKLLNLAQRTGTIVILINQMYMGAGAMPGGQMVPTPSGGNAMNYLPHMRIWFKRINGAAGKVLNSDGDQIGGKSKVTLMKTRYSEPWVESEFPIMFGTSQSDPITEFIFRAKAKGAEHIKENRKKLSYVHPDTGELLESKDACYFIKALSGLDAPDKRTKNDNSKTVLEYICGRIRMSSDQMNLLLEACDNILARQNDDSEEDDDE